jgi:hypothetical protein
VYHIFNGSILSILLELKFNGSQFCISFSELRTLENILRQLGKAPEILCSYLRSRADFFVLLFVLKTPTAVARVKGIFCKLRLLLEEFSRPISLEDKKKVSLVFFWYPC